MLNTKSIILLAIKGPMFHLVFLFNYTKINGLLKTDCKNDF